MISPWQRFLFDSNLWMRCVAWIFHWIAYPMYLVIELFFNSKSNERRVQVQAPQSPQTIVITGASQGIGEGLAEFYYRHCPSCQTIILISRNLEKLEQVKRRLNTNTTKQVILYSCDVTDADRMKVILVEIHRTYGQIDILFANAGVSFRQLSMVKRLDQAIQETFDVNITGVLNSILPLIEIRGVQQIALVSSQAGYAPIVSPIYGASKQCIISLGYDLRLLLAKDGIAVNIISPGPVSTPMLMGAYPKSVAHAMSTEDAAEIIARGLRRNQAEIVFPIVTGIFQYALRHLPLSIADAIATFILRR